MTIRKLTVLAHKLLLSLAVITWLSASATVAQTTTLSRLQQQINIINGEFLSTSTTDSPTNNSLGLVHYDASNYSSPSVFFEVVARCVDCTGGNEEVSVSLYSSSGSLVTTLTTDSSSNIRLRSGSLGLATGDYTIRFHRDATSGTAYVKAARLVINQTTSPITQTQTQIELGHHENRDSTSPVTLNSPKYYLYNHNNFSGDVDAYFEASFRTSNNLIGTSFVFTDYDSGSLEWSTNPANMVDGATVNYASTSTHNQVQRLTENASDGSDNGTISAVEIRVFGYQTNGSDGQVRLRPRFSGSTNGDNYDHTLPEDVGNAVWSSYFDITNDSNAPSTWTWSDIEDLDLDVIFLKGADGSNTAHVSSIQVRVTHVDTDVVAYVQLYNRTQNEIVTTVSTSENQTTRVRSAALSSNWNTDDADEYEVRVYTSDSANPIYLANAKIVLDQEQTGGLTRTELVHHYLTSTRQQTNTIYTQETFINLFEPDRFAQTNVVRAFFETTMRTSAGGEAYAALYDTDASSIIDDPVDSEILLSDNTSFTRQRTGNLGVNTDWPGTASELTTVIKAGSGDTATVSNSVLIIQAVALDPELTFTIAGVDQGIENNGITTSRESTITSLPFGNLGVNSPRYLAHELQVITNEAAQGYVVYISLEYQMQGYYPANFIDPFAGSGALWTSPQLWITPTGTTPNDNTGWIGANTTDTRVSGWSSGFARFGPLSTTPVEVMRSNVGDTDDTHVVSYGIEVNIFQPADTYSTILIYDVLPTY